MYDTLASTDYRVCAASLNGASPIYRHMIRFRISEWHERVVSLDRPCIDEKLTSMRHKV